MTSVNSSIRITRFVLVSVLFLAFPASASAVRDATAPERALIAAASGISDACLVATVSTIDPSWGTAMQRDTCAMGDTVLVRPSADALSWSAAGTVAMDIECPAPLVTDAVALDLSLCSYTGISALKAAAAQLSVTYKGPWVLKAKRWLECPAAYISSEDEIALRTMSCEFEFKTATGFVGGSFRLALGEVGYSYDPFSGRKYSKARKGCRIAANGTKFASGVQITKRSLQNSGWLVCANLKGAAGMVSDIDPMAAAKSPKRMAKRFKVVTHGTDTAGFEDRTVYNCVTAGTGLKYVVTCKNKLADSFVYSFTVKPKPKPPTGGGDSGGSGGSGCHPSYTGACLMQNSGDYDCAGGSGDGPNYTGPVTVVGPDEFDLDRDGDGSACE